VARARAGFHPARFTAGAARARSRARARAAGRFGRSADFTFSEPNRRPAAISIRDSRQSSRRRFNYRFRFHIARPLPFGEAAHFLRRFTIAPTPPSRQQRFASARFSFWTSLRSGVGVLAPAIGSSGRKGTRGRSNLAAAVFSGSPRAFPLLVPSLPSLGRPSSAPSRWRNWNARAPNAKRFGRAADARASNGNIAVPAETHRAGSIVPRARGHVHLPAELSARRTLRFVARPCAFVERPQANRKGATRLFRELIGVICKHTRAN